MKLRRLFILAIFLPTLVFSAEWYIDWVNGNDDTGDGSISTPWKTFEKAMANNEVVDPGDTVWARAGRYQEDLNLAGIWPLPTVRNGMPDNLVYWKEYPGEEVILDGFFRATCGDTDYGVNWCFDGWRITNSGTGVSGWKSTGANAGNVFELRNMEIDSNGACGVENGYGSHDFGTLRIINCNIHSNGKDKGSQQNTGIYTAAYGTVEIEDCHVWDNGDSSASYVSGKGISIAAGTSYSTGHVLRTVINDNIESGLDWSGPDSEIAYCQFYDNGWRDTEDPEYGDGNCKVHTGSEGTIVHHCLVVNPGRYNFEVFSDSVIVYNCTAIDTQNYGLQEEQADKAELMVWSGAEDCIFMNNIFVNEVPYTEGDDADLFLSLITVVAGADSGYESNKLDYNCYYSPESPSADDIAHAGTRFTLAELQAAFQHVNNDANSVGTLDPNFADRDSAGFNLASVSPCIDTGEDTITLANGTWPETIITSFNGSAPDMGWLESEAAGISNQIMIITH